MKRTTFLALLVLALAQVVPGQPANQYVNNGVITNQSQIIPGGQVDALIFINNDFFSIPVNELELNLNAPLLPLALLNPTVTSYTFSDVQNYTNNGIMACDTGFTFDNEPSSFGVNQASINFNNANTGSIFAGSDTNIYSSNFVFFVGVSPKINVNALNITNTGKLDVGLNGLISMTGNSVNLDRGDMHIEGFDDDIPLVTLVNTPNEFAVLLGGLDVGIFANDSGVGSQSNTITQANLTTPAAFSPATDLATSAGTAVLQQLVFTDGIGYATVNNISPSNITTQAVIVQDTGGKITPNVRFFSGSPFGTPVVQWLSVYTNAALEEPITNALYLLDFFGADTNLALATNIVFTSVPTPTGVPENYVITRSLDAYDGFATPGNTPYSVNLFVNGLTNGVVASNQYAALDATVQALTYIPNPELPTQNITNVGGRIEVTASNVLDLTAANISGPNYVRFTSTNDYVGSANANMIIPVADVNLRSAHGFLDITNLLAPDVPRLNGPVSCYSARWTMLTPGSNIIVTATNTTTNTFTITNSFHVLWVLSDLSPTAPAFVNNLVLNGTNVVISDLLNVTNSMSITAQSLTITTNLPGSQTPTGQLNLSSPNIAWSSSLSTNLEFLTNWGSISTMNTIYFQTRQQPNQSSPGDGPYLNFVNHGPVSSGAGVIIWANNFTNTSVGGSDASITAALGPLTVQSINALVTNSSLLATGPAGALSLTSANLTISNTTMQTSAPLSVGVTNVLTDLSQPRDLTNGGSGNVWLSGSGFNLNVGPASGNLLGTVISNGCPANAQCVNLCAGSVQALSTAPGVYTNLLPVMTGNAPIGQLVLNGGNTNSVFHFKGPDTINPYALYVDQIQLVNGATNHVPIGSSNVFTAFNVDPNVTVYFLDAAIGGLDISQKLNGAQNGHLVWLSNYVGRFSFTNLTFSDGLTFPFNRAFVQYAQGSGITILEPLTSETVGLTVILTNVGPLDKVAISWYAPAYSTNSLYVRNMTSTNWQVDTNYIQGAASGRVTILDSMTATNRLYKVGIVPLQ